MPVGPPRGANARAEGESLMARRHDVLDETLPAAQFDVKNGGTRLSTSSRAGTLSLTGISSLRSASWPHEARVRSRSLVDLVRWEFRFKR